MTAFKSFGSRLSVSKHVIEPLTGALIVAVSFQLGAQTLSDDGKAALDSYLGEAIGTTRIPGMVALVVNKDGVVYEEAFGLMDSANGKAMTTDAIFRLASMTKPVTSALIMMLAEEGKVDVDASVATYLPDLANPQVFTSFNLEDGTYTAEPAKNAMTPRHLLTHTSGLGYTFTSDILVKAMTGVAGARATSYPLLFEPGTQWHYGESTRVLGDIVEAVTGEELLAYMKARLLDPLGMTDTTYDVPAEKNSRVVTVHRSDGTQLIEQPNPEGAITSPHQGDGGLSGTARDYAQFIRLILNDGTVDGKQLMKPETVALMKESGSNGVRVQRMTSTNRLTSEDFPIGAGVDTFSLGFHRTEEQLPGLRSVGSLAWAGIFNTEFWIDPERGIGAVLLMQYLPFYDADAIEVLQGFEQRVYSGLQ
ncbi:MAG: serine hydrolase domain-containing protein [Pseudomonadota bacterium]|nr:serine hydrolase domain-containing protein [Pseudomonadota bacterium]